MKLLGEPSLTTFHRRFRWLDPSGRNTPAPRWDLELAILLGRCSVHFTEVPLSNPRIGPR